MLDWVDLVTASIRYIEANLSEPKLGPEMVARKIGVAPAPLQRAFGILTDLAMGDYIRNRRLSLAGQDLAGSGASVLETALNWGYESPEAFSKAFTRYHGINPRDAKSPDAPLKSFGRMVLKVTREGSLELPYRLVRRPAFALIGVTVSRNPDEEAAAVEAAWEALSDDGTLARLRALPGARGLAGICLPDGSYAVGVEAAGPLPGLPFGQWTVPEGPWAVFPCPDSSGPQVDGTWKRIYGAWLPDIGFDLAEGPQLELYAEEGGRYSCQILVPVAAGPARS